MGNEKHYSERAALGLVERVAAESSAAKARRTLSELLEAPLGDVVVARAAREELLRASDRRVLEWFHRTRDQLRMIAKARAFHIGAAVTAKATVTISASRARVEVSGPVGQMLTIRAYVLMRLVGQRVEECGAIKGGKPCGQLFVRTGKRLFCSIRCQKRDYMRRFRSGEAGGE